MNEAGYYTLLVADEFGCEASAPSIQITFLDENHEACKPIGISELTLGDIEIYPNPNKGVFSVVLNPIMNLDEVSLQITNPLGEVVYETQFSELNSELKTEIDLSHMAQGIYAVTISSKSLIETRKLTIQK